MFTLFAKRKGSERTKKEGGEMFPCSIFPKVSEMRGKE
jgi:hypothetical protein